MNGNQTNDSRTMVERTSDREVVVTRYVRAPARLVFQAWATPELFQRWWAPKSCEVSIVSFEADIRTGGTYHLLMSHPSAEQPMAFFGRYLEVTPPSRIVWTNDEGEGEGAITTVTFDDRSGETLVSIHDLYPSKEALDEAIASGATSGWSEQLDQLQALLLRTAGEPERS